MALFYMTFIFLLMGLGNSAELKKEHRPITTPDMGDIHFLLWTKGNKGDSDYYELLIDNATNLSQSPFKSSRPTYVLIHGWNSNGHSGWVVDGKTELLKNSDCNTIAVDWGKISQNLDYFAVVRSMDEVSTHVAKFFGFLHDKGNLDITALRLTGHSLGAHLSGLTGAKVSHGPLARITGLDPAGPEFYSVDNSKRLDKTDAKFVEIIHSNGGPLQDFCAGLIDVLGHVDYFPNGGHHQPGCTDFGNIEELLTGGCSHGRSCKYWVESINGKVPFKSNPCSDWDKYEKGDCDDCGAGCLDMGFHASTKLTGTYYLETNDKAPFAKG